MGPIILRNFPKPFSTRYKYGKPQKHKEVISLLNTYPKLKFILIGDSGEHDPFIYKKIAENFPDRISAIYLRSVRHRSKMRRVISLYTNYNLTPILLVDSSAEAIAHARLNGFIL